jgi:hypothetical protein
LGTREWALGRGGGQLPRPRQSCRSLGSLGTQQLLLLESGWRLISHCGMHLLVGVGDFKNAAIVAIGQVFHSWRSR